MNNIQVGSKVLVKEEYKSQLGREPAYGEVANYNPKTRKVTIAWCNGMTSIHDINLPYLQRYNIEGN